MFKIGAFVLLLAFSGCATFFDKLTSEGSLIVADSAKTARPDYRAIGKKYAISTQGILASKVAEEILKAGGNLIDAFVAASFAISVERPQSTGIGGGGFLVFYDAKAKENVVLDFRERAPLRAHRDLYFDKNGSYRAELSKDGILSAGVPGLVKGLFEIHKKYGKMNWKEVLAPSIRMAEEGFVVYPHLEKALEERKNVLSRFADSKKIFLKEDGSAYRTGELLVQKDLSKTLRAIAENGSSEFYEGTTAQKILRFAKEQGGLFTSVDLKKYKTIQRKPIESEFLNYKIVSMPPPSSGGVHVIQFLKMLEKEKWTSNEMNTAKVIHYQASALQMAFADRAKYLGDPDFVNVPTSQLISEHYLNQRKKEILRDRARSASELSYGDINLKKESTETTHLSLMDSEGNAISSTQTINGRMGSGAIVTGTGILLNNEMDDFSAKPGSANLYGAIGSQNNEIAPFKTPLSSMSPTLVFNEFGKPILAVGAPGGTRIISCTASTIFNHLFFKRSLEESIMNIRIHHQWQPDILFVEKPGPPKADFEKLKAMGYKIDLDEVPCRVMAVSFNSQSNELNAVADPRDIGKAIAW